MGWSQAVKRVVKQTGVHAVPVSHMEDSDGEPERVGRSDRFARFSL
ncbi:MAG: hypothetical protein WB502_15985 [Thermoactinomyces sp.]